VGASDHIQILCNIQSAVHIPKGYDYKYWEVYKGVENSISENYGIEFSYDHVVLNCYKYLTVEKNYNHILRKIM